MKWLGFYVIFLESVITARPTPVGECSDVQRNTNKQQKTKKQNPT